MKTLGLDLGISSVGWALMESDNDDDGDKITDLGVRIFMAGQAMEQGKRIGPPAQPRREARSSRRTLRRKKARLTKIKKLLRDYNLTGSIESLFYNKKITDVWELRANALKEKISPEDFSRILIHTAKHRGYISSLEPNDNDADDKKSKETGEIKKAILKTQNDIEKFNYQTYGEYVYNNAVKNDKTSLRNRRGAYIYFPTIDLIKEEIDTIFEKQAQFGNDYATDELKNKYLEIINSVKEPKSFENMVGLCQFFNDRNNGKKRAPKHSYSAERFVLLTSILNTVVIAGDFKEIKIVDIKPLKDIVEFAYKKDSDNITYKQLKDFLSIDEKSIFKGINYDKKRKTDPESKKFVSLQGFNTLKRICGEEIASNKDLSLKITQILAYQKGINARTKELSGIKELDTDMINALAKLDIIKDFINLSAEAIDIILPMMEDGLRYDEAVQNAIDKEILPAEKNLKQDLLPALDKTDILITNPTVLRALSEARKVINAVIRKYGKLDRINIELARDIKTKKENKNYIQLQTRNKDNKTQAEKLLNERGISSPNSKDILKAKLYIQQNGISPYSGETIQLERLLEDGYCQVDHILPQSKSMDDGFNNKVLCLASENQNKGNYIPYEWFTKIGQFETFKSRILSMKDALGYRKVHNLLADKINTEDFIERNLNDTRYISKTCKNYLETYLKIGENDKTRKVCAVNGILTSKLRHQWGLGNKDRTNDKHHAEDAVIIALTNAGMVKKLSDYYGERELKKHPVFAEPFDGFSKILNEKLDNLPEGRLLVSRPPRKKITGAAHKETVKSPKEKDDSMVKIHNGKGYAEQALMPRLDVFKKEGKYYYVPIYVADFAKKEFPNKIITIGKKKLEWDILDDSYKFLFSLYKDDLIEVKQKSKDKVMGYYQNIGISVCQITYQNIDGSKKINGKGKDSDPYFSGKTLEYFRKYQIDPLGFYYEIKKERRCSLSAENIDSFCNQRQ